VYRREPRPEQEKGGVSEALVRLPGRQRAPVTYLPRFAYSDLTALQPETRLIIRVLSEQQKITF